MTISMDKQYRARDGRKVRVYALDGAYGRIHGAILQREGWVTIIWNKNGREMDAEDSGIDLIEVKPRIQREYWVNVCEHWRTDPILHATKEDADDVGRCKMTRLACVKIVIDCEEGEGL